MAIQEVHTSRLQQRNAPKDRLIQCTVSRFMELDGEWLPFSEKQDEPVTPDAERELIQLTWFPVTVHGAVPRR